MNKNWTKIEETKYSFSIDDNLIGTLEIFINTIDSKGFVKIGDEIFTIRRTGFWRNKIEITDDANNLIANVYAEKWYANSLTLIFKKKNYKLAIRNNPLAEWAITDENKDLLTYGLNSNTAKGMTNIKIISSENNQEYLLDFLLWYLFVPIATENMGDDITPIITLLVN